MEIKPYTQSETYKAEQAKPSTDAKLLLAINKLQEIQSLLDPNSKPTSVAGKIYDITVLALARLRDQ